MDIKEIKSVEVMPGFKGRIIHGSDFTWVYWEIENGASLKEPRKGLYASFSTVHP